MNRWMQVLVIGLCLWAPLFVRAARAEVIPVPNGGFEEGENIPKGYRTNDVEGADFYYDKEIAHSGKRSVAIENHSKKGAYWSLKKAFAVKAGEKYRICVWIKTEDADGGTGVMARLKGKGLKPCNILNQPLLNKTNDWTHISLEAEIPEKATSMAIHLIHTKGSMGRVWFDNLSLEKID